MLPPVVSGSRAYFSRNFDLAFSEHVDERYIDVQVHSRRRIKKPQPVAQAGHLLATTSFQRQGTMCSPQLDEKGDGVGKTVNVTTHVCMYV